MIDVFDSRALRLTDCYAQRFMKAGTYRYHVLPVGGYHVTADRPFAVKVKERAAQTRMTQHTVAVKSAGANFRVEPAEITIEAGDLVLWNGGDARAMPYVVIGDKEFFGSHRLFNESGYSHAFAVAGDYPWRDAYGSGAAGIVRVKDPDCKTATDFQHWHRALTKGSLVTISDARVEPREIAIVTGQTVFFAITQGPGVSITDQRVVDGPGGYVQHPR